MNAGTACSTRDTVQLGEYTAHAARRLAELGYMLPPMEVRRSQVSIGSMVVPNPAGSDV